MTTIDPNSREWREIEAWANERLERHRRYLEAPGLEPVPTETIRGQIVELKTLLKLVVPSKIGVE